MNIISQIHQELNKNIDEKYKADSARFFKGGVLTHKFYGVRTPIVRKLAVKHWKEIKNKSKEEVFELCEELASSKISEPQTIAFQWAFGLRKQYEISDFKLFVKWLENYVDEWGKCDDLCCKSLGELVFQFPELLPKVFVWTKSQNIWLRRAAAVCLIPSLRRGKYLEQAFKIADALIVDNEDLVQKGYGWMLKEASNVFQKEVFDYVMKNKRKGLDTDKVGVVPSMTRTALIYAIEKMPESLRKKAMS